MQNARLVGRPTPWRSCAASDWLCSAGRTCAVRRGSRAGASRDVQGRATNCDQPSTRPCPYIDRRRRATTPSRRVFRCRRQPERRFASSLASDVRADRANVPSGDVILLVSGSPIACWPTRHARSGRSGRTDNAQQQVQSVSQTLRQEDEGLQLLVGNPSHSYRASPARSHSWNNWYSQSVGPPSGSQEASCVAITSMRQLAGTVSESGGGWLAPVCSTRVGPAGAAASYSVVVSRRCMHARTERQVSPCRAHRLRVCVRVSQQQQQQQQQRCTLTLRRRRQETPARTDGPRERRS